MIYAEVSDASARDHLESALCEATHLKWYRRLMIIKLSATEGLSVPHLAKLFNLSDDSVRSYIHKYNTSGLEALMPKSPPDVGVKSRTLVNLIGSDFLSKPLISMKNFRRSLVNGRLT